MKFIAITFIVLLAAKLYFSIKKMVETAKRGGKHECSIDFAEVVAFIFSGRILGWW